MPGRGDLGFPRLSPLSNLDAARNPFSEKFLLDKLFSRSLQLSNILIIL